MYRIAVLAEQEAERQRYAEQITRFCESKGLFPQVVQYDDQERFFEAAQKDAPTNAVIALSGVAAFLRFPVRFLVLPPVDSFPYSVPFSVPPIRCPLRHPLRKSDAKAFR